MTGSFKKILILFSICVQTGWVFAQGNFILHPNQIKLSPFRVLDLVNPGVEMSYERRFNQKFSSQLSLGFMTDLFHLSTVNKYKGFRTSFEEKYFLNTINAEHYYLSSEVIFVKVNFKDVALYKKDTSRLADRYIDSFDVSKQTFSINFQYGIQIPGKRWVLDVHAGLGLKYKMVKRKGVQDSNAIEQTAIDINVYDISGKQGNYFIFNVPVNIKIGYLF